MTCPSTLPTHNLWELFLSVIKNAFILNNLDSSVPSIIKLLEHCLVICTFFYCKMLLKVDMNTDFLTTKYKVTDFRMNYYNPWKLLKLLECILYTCREKAERQTLLLINQFKTWLWNSFCLFASSTNLLSR